MRKAIIILLLCIPLAVTAKEYYVATNGSDSNSGTLASPWKTWAKGVASITAGDILYIRGGTYTDMQGLGSGNYCGVQSSGKSGTAGAHITVSAYPGDSRPILNCTALTGIQGYHRGILLTDCSYWDFYGLIIENVREWSGGVTQYTGSAWEMANVSNINITFCDVTYCMNGFSLSAKNTNIYYTNCDAYENWDVYQGGDLCNGFNGNNNIGSTIFYKGCRAWKNCDDGFDDMGGGGYITYNNCWAFNNKPWHGGDGAGNGDGFKLGYSTKTSESGVQRTLNNCVAANNGLMGFDESMDAGTTQNMVLYNCTAYNNSDYYSFRFDQSAGSSVTTLRNNISIGAGSLYSGRSRNIQDHNSWNGGVTANASDFQSVDYTQLGSPRNSDGSLPTITAFHLVAGSDLIDAGVNVGLPFSGKAPDLGAFEQQGGSTAVVAPVYKSGVVENATPSLVELTYDLTLTSSVVPVASSFKISVNSVARAVNAIVISGSKVQLTLASAIKFGDIINVSYTKPATNPLQTAIGGAAATISGQQITNHITSPTVSGTAPKITMTINPNPTHRIMNIIFAYASTFSKQDPAVSPQIIRIMDITGKLFIEKILATGVANIKFPINLDSGIYIVMVLSGGQDISSQKIIVY